MQLLSWLFLSIYFSAEFERKKQKEKMESCMMNENR